MHEIVMPKLGNTVESVIIVEWRKEVGERVNIGEALCEVETDKSTIEVEAKEEGILLARLFEAGDEVPILGRFAILGEESENASTLPAFGAQGADVNEQMDTRGQGDGSDSSSLPEAAYRVDEGAYLGISPRARKLARSAGLNPNHLTESAADGIAPGVIPGTGPGGRIIERDVKEALESFPGSGADSSVYGSIATGISGPSARESPDKTIPMRNTASDSALSPGSSREPSAHTGEDQVDFPGAFEVIPVEGARRIIASRMHASLRETTQLTLNTSAPAGSILAWVQSFKSPLVDPVEGQDVSINHLLMFSVARLLPHHLELNATFHGNAIRRYTNVHLGFAVDTLRGLMTPVIRNANRRDLSSLTAEARRLANACREDYITPNELAGSTFTVTNLGALGIESFTPVLNAPEVGVLGIGAITNSPVETKTGIGIEKRIGLSLTIDHQAVDGAPGARFLAHLVRVLTKLELVALL